ncbi:hypothetical protein FVA74_00075 [Salinibacterium sp. dk2585]|uniref:DUF6049 family protein n=1 Tax=unclassified Salinibacterium TaxID=2632331 RepID=UPI0011C247F4|nr:MULTISPECIES: DUF6049 family protein [unclassified Salinibacterium]QEE60129.1 hypothetical protein FVA74_00075 [Salinibacterium sp. dk2585]TXK55201.1 hypothetical protein FVP63_00220 [Salinibacterium sp. dk5596]
MPLTRLASRWGAALLGAALVLSGSVASSATPDATPSQTPPPGVAASDGSPTSLVLAMPIVVPAGTASLLSGEELELYTSPTGVLTRQLDAVIDRPVALGVDPRILASIRILGTGAPESAIEWLDRLQDASNETFSLAYADADVAALSQAGMTDLSVPTDFVIDPSVFPNEVQEGPGASPSASPGVSPSPSPTTPAEPVVPTGEDLIDLPFTLGPVVWPRDDTVVGADLEVFATLGDAVTVLDSSNASYPRDAIPASARAGGHRIVVSNNDISAFLRDAVSAPTEAAWNSSMSQLTAALAGWTGGSATVLATFDRDIPSTGNRIAATLTELSTTPGITLTTLSRTLAEDPVEIGIVDRPVSAERITPLQSALQTMPATTAFASVLEDPSLITGEQRRRMFTLASNAWVETSADWQGAVEEFVAGAAELLSSVHVLDSSTINLLSDTGDIPITISNTLPYPVTVNVQVWANRAVLDVLDDSVPVTISAQSQARAAVPVQSIANGSAVLVVTLSSQTGVSIGAPLYVTTNVQAGWETAFTFVVAGVVLLVFVIGIIRTVARRRREGREAQ